jgi:hypothetical protein
LIIDAGAVTDNHILAVALQNACAMGKLSTAQLLIQHCDTSNTQCLQTALGRACTGGQLTVLFWLMDVMKLSPADTIKWWLITASARGELDTVRHLIRRKTLYTTEDVVSDGLRVACYKSRTNVVDWLMTHTSADASKRGELFTDVEGGITSLHAACCDVRSTIIQLVLSSVTPHTVNMQCTDTSISALGLVISHSDSTLHISCSDGDIVEVTRRLDTTSNIDEQDNTGRTLLHRACFYGHVEIVRLLLSMFARTDITNDDGVTQIETARRQGYMNIVNLLENPMSATRAANTNISTHVTSISANAHVASVTQVMVSSATDD